MADEIDTLMSKDPLEMTSNDLDAIIAYYRNRRAAASGPKPKKDTGPGLKIDLQALGLKPKSSTPVIPIRKL